VSLPNNKKGDQIHRQILVLKTSRKDAYEDTITCKVWTENLNKLFK